MKMQFLRREDSFPLCLFMWSQADRAEEKNTLTQTAYSESVGSYAHFRCMQLGRRRLFHDLLLPVPRLDTEAPQIRHLVSCLSYAPHCRDLFFLVSTPFVVFIKFHLPNIHSNPEPGTPRS
jgi:hypothetical protein